MKLFRAFLSGLTCVALWGGLTSSVFPESFLGSDVLESSIEDRDVDDSALRFANDTLRSVDLVQAQPDERRELGQQLVQELSQCLSRAITERESDSPTELQAVSMRCTIQVILLDETGNVRPDASDRMTALLAVTGASVPQTTSRGQATVSLEKLPDGQIFTVPVEIAGQSQRFLLDTGASNSILSQQIIQPLGLLGIQIPSELLSYFVVGDDCSSVTASLHRLPPVQVNAAVVEGMMGMGLSQNSIPGGLTGVLGMDFLKGFDVVVDPKALTLQLLTSSTPVEDAIPLQGKLGVMTTQVYINGQGPFSFLLDTGADLMVVSQRLTEQLSIPTNATESVDVRGFCGVELGQKTQLGSVRLQSWEQRDLDAVVLDNEIFDLLGVEGIVGQNYLTQYQQYWRFGEASSLGFSETGSLSLDPL